MGSKKSFNEFKGHVDDDIDLSFAMRYAYELAEKTAIEDVTHTELMNRINKKINGLSENNEKMSYDVAETLLISLNPKYKKSRENKEKTKKIYKPMLRSINMLASAYHGTFISYVDTIQSESNKAVKISSDFWGSVWEVWHIYNKADSTFYELNKSILFVASTYEIYLKSKSGNSYLGKANRTNVHCIINVEQQNVVDSEKIHKTLILALISSTATYIEGYMIATSLEKRLYKNDILLSLVGRGEDMYNKQEATSYEIFGTDYYKEDLVKYQISRYFKNVDRSKHHTSGQIITDDINDKTLNNIILKRRKIFTAYKHDLYISSPASTIDEKTFEKSQKLILAIIKKLCSLTIIGSKIDKLFKKEKVHAPATYDKDQKNLTHADAKKKLKSRKRYEHAFKEWNRSRCYMLIMSANVDSVAKIQAGWTLTAKKEFIKPSVFIFDNSIKEPNKIFKDENFYGKRGAFFRIDMQKPVKEIIEELFSDNNTEKIRDVYSQD